MQRTVGFIRVIVFMLGFIAVVRPVSAQDPPKAEISGGYQFCRLSDVNWPKGWYVDVTGNVSSAIGIVGQVSGMYKTETTTFESADANVHAFLAGVRFSVRSNAKIVPFGQVLAGAAHLSSSATSTFSGRSFTSEYSETDADLQLGGGVNLSAGNTIGIRLGLDYRRLFTKSEAANGLRLTAGVVVPFGAK